MYEKKQRLFLSFWFRFNEQFWQMESPVSVATAQGFSTPHSEHADHKMNPVLLEDNEHLATLIVWPLLNSGHCSEAVIKTV